jgi:hypothetical protein
MMRYTAAWVPDAGKVNVIDTYHGSNICGVIYLHRTHVDGIGWCFASRTQAGSSRVLHASPMAVLLSMRYMTTRTARDALSATEDAAARAAMVETTIQPKVKKL